MISIVFTMVLICLLMMPMYYLKTHLILAVLSMTFSTALVLFNLFLAYAQYIYITDNINHILCIISMVFSGLLAIIMVVLILNPKLTFKIYLDKTIDTKGNEVLKRPRVIFLALNEWVSIFVYFLSPIGILLVNLVW